MMKSDIYKSNQDLQTGTGGEHYIRSRSETKFNVWKY